MPLDHRFLSRDDLGEEGSPALGQVEALGAPLPPPQVDFRREMVLAVAAGRMSANDRIRVDSVGVRKEPGADGKTHEVLSVLVLTTAGCRSFSTPVWPVQIVRVARYGGPVKFVERREPGDGCGR